MLPFENDDLFPILEYLRFKIDNFQFEAQCLSFVGFRFGLCLQKTLLELDVFLNEIYIL